MKKLKQLLYKFFWITLCFLLVVALFSLGHSNLHHRSPKSESPAEFYSRETHDDLQLTLTEAIKDAKQSLHLIIYTLKDHRILKALRKQAEEGVDVRVICDAQASKGITKKLGPDVKVILRKGQGLMHQKILVTDNRKVWIGSANMTTASLKMHSNLVIGFDNPELALMIKSKFDQMSTEGLVQAIPSQEFSNGGQKFELWFLPDNSEGAEKVKSLINSAKKTIRVAMFTWTRMDFAQAILEAQDRGIIAEVILDRNAASSSSKEIAKELFNQNVPVRVNTGNGLLHHKLMIIDDTILLTGSANWTYSAFKKNDDCFLIIYDLSKEQRKALILLWNQLFAESELFLEKINSPNKDSDS